MGTRRPIAHLGGRRSRCPTPLPRAVQRSPPTSFVQEDLWLIDLETGTERQLTNLLPEFDVRDFDISPDGREVVLERMQVDPCQLREMPLTVLVDRELVEQPVNC
jgi:hypothetical protein